MFGGVQLRAPASRPGAGKHRKRLAREVLVRDADWAKRLDQYETLTAERPRYAIELGDDGSWELRDHEGTVLERAAVPEGLEGAELTRAERQARTDLVGQLERIMEASSFALAESARGGRFRMEFREEDPARDDGFYRRVIDAGATVLDRTPPLPLMILRSNSAGGHEGAELAGVIDTAERVNETTLRFEGFFDAGSEAGQEAERVVGEGVLTTWSPDMSQTTWDEEAAGQVDEDGMPEYVILHAVETHFLGGTITPFQALDSAQIALVSGSDSDTSDEGQEQEAEEEETDAEAAAAVRSIVSAVEAPGAPPAEWFDNPEFDALTPLTITDDGQIYGHLAPWGQCHIGHAGTCITPPTSAAGYAYFTTGEVRTCDNDCPSVPTGVITLGTGHADLSLAASDTVAHYDHTGTAVADIAAGEDEYGIWVAGALRPGVTEEQVRQLRSSSLSGDWRRIGGNLELVAALAVNVPGFPIPRARARVASAGGPQALVAAGAMAKVSHRSTPADTDETRIAALERRFSLLAPTMAAELLRRLRGDTN